MTRIPLHDRMALSVEEAAAYCGVSRSTGYRLVNDGTWPYVVLAGKLRIARRDLEAWLEDNRKQWRKGA